MNRPHESLPAPANLDQSQPSPEERAAAALVSMRATHYEVAADAFVPVINGDGSTLEQGVLALSRVAKVRQSYVDPNRISVVANRPESPAYPNGLPGDAAINIDSINRVTDKPVPTARILIRDEIGNPIYVDEAFAYPALVTGPEPDYQTRRVPYSDYKAYGDRIWPVTNPGEFARIAGEAVRIIAGNPPLAIEPAETETATPASILEEHNLHLAALSFADKQRLKVELAGTQEQLGRYLGPLISEDDGALVGLQTVDGKTVYINECEGAYDIWGLEYIDPSVPMRRQYAQNKSFDRPQDNRQTLLAEEGFRHQTPESATRYIVELARQYGFEIEGLAEDAVIDTAAARRFRIHDFNNHYLDHDVGGPLRHLRPES